MLKNFLSLNGINSVDIKSYSQTVTPEMAKKILSLNTENFRNIDVNRIKQFSDEMKAGNWQLNGETIKISEDGVLIDGQHRLHAIMKSMCSADFLIVSDIPKNSAMTVDRGKPRTIAQWLNHAKVKNAALVAAVARQCVAYNKGYWTNISWGTSIMTDSEVIEYAEKHKETIATYKRSTNKIIPGSFLGAVCFIGSGEKAYGENELVSWFLDALLSGLNLQETDPVYHLRQILLSPVTKRPTPFMSKMMLTKAWNKTVKGEPATPRSIQIKVGGQYPDVLPEQILVAEDWEK